LWRPETRLDNLAKEERSNIMARVRGKDTKPEMTVRRLIFSMGYRYRLHGSGLPGKPDLVFLRRKKVIFVHGCFWHRHYGCKNARLPKSRQEFWIPKLESNRLRDTRNEESLRAKGWDVLTIWECELRDPSNLTERIKGFLGPTRGKC
jgi:DNA mismatch endonuclease (patch repair protein)